jgi:MFS family permease
MLVSFTGTWMQSVAQSWLVYRLTESAWLLGLVGFIGQVPVFLLAPAAGVIADRHSRHRIIILTQALSMAQAMALAWLSLSGQVTVNAVLALALMLGVVNAFDLPARQSFLVELVGKRDLMNAISLNSTMVNGARIIGPAVAGIIIAWIGEGLCFLINGLSYLAVILSLFTIKIANVSRERPDGSILSNLLEGFDYIRRTETVRALLLLVALVSFCGLPYIVLMPIFADQVLGGGPRVLGILLGSAGVGALLGALALAVRRTVHGLGRLVTLSVASFGVAIIAFSLSSSLILSTLLILPAGFTLMIQMSGSNTLLQSVVPDRMRGRAMSFYSMSLMGVAPFGNLFAGAIATRIGAARTVTAGGIICLIGVMLVRFKIVELGEHPALLDSDPSAMSQRTDPATTPLDETTL